MVRPSIYDDNAALAKAHSEKIAKGEYEVVSELEPEDIEEYENIIAAGYAHDRAIDRAFRAYSNHMASNYRDLTDFYQRVSKLSRYDLTYAGMFITRHAGKVVLARDTENNDD
jgi:ferric iron reductase protein FhuF